MSTNEERLRWRFTKVVILSWARMGKDSEYIKYLESDIERAYEMASSGVGGSLVDQLIPLTNKWGQPIYKGLEWLVNGKEEALAALNEKERALIINERVEHLSRCLSS